MKSSMLHLLALTLIVGAAATLGCKKEAADKTGEPAATGSTASDEAADDAADEPADAAADESAGTSTDEPADTGETTETSLTDADKAAILAQKICPVSGEDLGSMGDPIKVTVDGRDVFVCCDQCVEPLKAEPAKYLAKLDAPAADEGAAADADGDTATQ
jgi:hypothetical protein